MRDDETGVRPPNYAQADHIQEVIYKTVGLDHERGFKARNEARAENLALHHDYARLKSSVQILVVTRWMLRLYIWTYGAGFLVGIWPNAPVSLSWLGRLGSANPLLIILPWMVLSLLIKLFTSAQKKRLAYYETTMGLSDRRRDMFR